MNSSSAAITVVSNYFHDEFVRTWNAFGSGGMGFSDLFALGNLRGQMVLGCLSSAGYDIVSPLVASTYRSFERVHTPSMHPFTLGFLDGLHGSLMKSGGARFLYP